MNNKVFGEVNLKLKVSGRKIICYGIGFSCELTLKMLSNFNLTVDYFADTNKYGVEFHGCKVLSPSELIALDRRESVCIFISSDAYGKEIYESLKKLGVQGQVLKLPLYISGKIPLESEIERFYADAAVMRQRLLDDTSCKILDLLLKARLTFDPENYICAFELTAAASGEKNYLLNELRDRLTAKPMSVVDCGAYTGDTLEDMVKWGVCLSETWCFEPDPNNHGALEKRIEQLELKNRVHLVKSGVHSKTGTLCFNSTGYMDARVSADGGDLISVVSIDEYLAGKHVDLIKMDIEGAEMDALAGAEQTIERCRPVLAVSVYHSFYDLTSLPLYMMKQLKQYSFILRHHTSGFVDTVLYCVPEEFL